MHIANLPCGGRKECIAVVPNSAGQFGNGGGCFVNGVVCQLGVSNVALNANHFELATERTTASILDHVTGFFNGSGFTHNAKIGRLVSRLQQLANAHRAIEGRAFFVAGQQKRDA